MLFRIPALRIIQQDNYEGKENKGFLPVKTNPSILCKILYFSHHAVFFTCNSLLSLRSSTRDLTMLGFEAGETTIAVQTTVIRIG